MANFDTNKWYQLNVGEGTSQSMAGSVLFDHGKGSVFFTITNTSDPQQQWQLYPYNTTYYVLRSHASGPFGYMSVDIGTDESTPGNTVPLMSNVTLFDDSMFWVISPWGDGTFYLTNAANGTDWHLQVRSNSLMSMNSNITAPQSGQSFSFTEKGDINSTDFSTVSIPSVTSTTTSTASPTQSKSTATSSSSSSSGSLSTGAEAGIGIGVAAMALITLLFLGLFFLRRRKHKGAQATYPAENDSNYDHKAMMPSEVQQLASFSDAHNGQKLTWIPQELDPATAARYEMEAGKERERKGRSVSPYRPGLDNEQKVVMPQVFFGGNEAVEMDAMERPVQRSELPGEGRERGR